MPRSSRMTRGERQKKEELESLALAEEEVRVGCSGGGGFYCLLRSLEGRSGGIGEMAVAGG